MRFILTLLFIFLMVTSTQAVSWDLVDEPCNDFTTVFTWSDDDLKNGVSEIDPAGQFHMYNSVGESGSLAIRSTDIGTYPEDVTLELKLYCDTIGTLANADGFRIFVGLVTDGLRLFIRWCSDGLFVYDGTSFNEVGTDIVTQDTWQTWRFLVDGSAQTMDVYLDGVEQATGVDCSWSSDVANGATRIDQAGYNTATESHLDYIKAATGLHIPVEVGSQVIITEMF